MDFQKGNTFTAVESVEGGRKTTRILLVKTKTDFVRQSVNTFGPCSRKEYNPTLTPVLSFVTSDTVTDRRLTTIGKKISLWLCLFCPS